MQRRHLLFLIILTLFFYSSLSISSSSASQPLDTANTSPAIKDLFSSKTAQLKMDDISLHFPMSYDSFLAKGWEYMGNPSTKLGAFQYSPSECFRHDSFCVYVLVLNTHSCTAPISECTISGIFIDQAQIDDAPQTTIFLPGDIEFGRSGKEQIISTYGQPSSKKQDKETMHLVYEYAPYQRLDLFLDPDTGILNEIDLQNMPEYASLTSSVSDIDFSSSKANDLKYIVPKELGSNLLSYNVEFEDTLYHLPAPISEFLKHGWTLNNEKTDLVIAGQSFGWVYLQKDDQEYYAVAVNYSQNASDIKNCYITSVEANQDQFSFSLQLPLQITLETSEKDLLSVIKDLSFKEETDSEHSEKLYTIEDPDNAMNYLHFTVDTKTSLISAIEISHIPTTL